MFAFAIQVALAAFVAPEGSFHLVAARAAKAPVIDGRVGETEWRVAAHARDFIQIEPHRGEPAGVRTEASVAYDETHLYVAFRAFDTEPLTAQLTQRDADLLADDAVVVILDSALDRQSAAYFMMNPLGTQADGKVTEDGGRVDATWDTRWRSATYRHAQGWTAEIAIPLASIKFAAGKGRSWGLNLGRSRARTREVAFWAGPLERRMQVSVGGTLSGLDLAPPADRFQVVPYALSSVEQRSPTSWNAGIDARFALTPELSLNGTINPDFATIEADQEQVNLTRFELSLREKRQFFLEGSELFNQRIRTFYSRRIADIDEGLKLIGKTGDWNVAALQARAQPAGGTGIADYGVVRGQLSLGRSFVALMGANRRFGGLDEGSLGVDTNLVFTPTLSMTGQVVRSHGRYGRGSWAYIFRPTYSSSTTQAHVRYTHLGDRFGDNANAVGFVADDNRREVSAGYLKTARPRSGVVERVMYQFGGEVYWGQDGRRRGRDLRPHFEIDLRNRWTATGTYVSQFRRFEKDFYNDDLSLTVGYNTREYQSLEAGYSFGRNFDSDFALWSATARRKLTKTLSAEYELQRLTLDPDPSGTSTWIHVFRASEFFTRDLFLKVLFQTNSAIERRNVQAVFVYRHRPPFGTIQAAYQRGTASFGQRSEQGNTLFVKVTGVF